MILIIDHSFVLYRIMILLLHKDFESSQFDLLREKRCRLANVIDCRFCLLITINVLKERNKNNLRVLFISTLNKLQSLSFFSLDINNHSYLIYFAFVRMCISHSSLLLANSLHFFFILFCCLANTQTLIDAAENNTTKSFSVSRIETVDVRMYKSGIYTRMNEGF